MSTTLLDSSHVVEATTMTLKIVSPKPYTLKTPFDDYFYNDIDSYIYNHTKSLRLSQKSLELCTESLGSESGSDMSDDVDAVFASLLVAKKSRRDKLEKKKLLPRSFPPPLMTMSGEKLFQVRPHREGGRLIIEAIETDLINSCFRVERSEGRLRLTCLKDENDMKDDLEKFQRVRRCNEHENNGDKGICWDPSCWVAIS